jgi:hypothetical protein
MFSWWMYATADVRQYCQSRNRRTSFSGKSFSPARSRKLCKSSSPAGWMRMPNWRGIHVVSYVPTIWMMCLCFNRRKTSISCWIIGRRRFQSIVRTRIIFRANRMEPLSGLSMRTASTTPRDLWPSCLTVINGTTL